MNKENFVVLISGRGRSLIEESLSKTLESCNGRLIVHEEQGEWEHLNCNAYHGKRMLFKIGEWSKETIVGVFDKTNLEHIENMKSAKSHYQGDNMDISMDIGDD